MGERGSLVIARGKKEALTLGRSVKTDPLWTLGGIEYITGCERKLKKLGRKGKMKTQTDNTGN